MIFIYSFLIFFLGVCLGSFANVCIYRLPKNKQIVSGRSFCPKCKKSGLVTPAEQKQFGLKIGTIVSRPNGCMSCYQTGYKGRIVLTELLELNDNIRDYINNSKKILDGDTEQIKMKYKSDNYLIVHDKKLKKDVLKKLKNLRKYSFCTAHAYSYAHHLYELHLQNI
mgnify:CR=1 FL=1